MLKNTLCYFFLCFWFFSCSPDQEEEQPVIEVDSQKWVLKGLKNSVTGIETMESSMGWQEYYIFNSDSTFLKSISQKGEIFWNIVND